MSGLDGFTKLLCHFDGTDASTTIVDTSGNQVNGTCVANAQLDTAQFKFGTASLLLDGTGDYVTFPDSADWNYGAGNFTIDFWIRPTNDTATAVFFEQYVDANNQVSLELATNLRFVVRSGGLIVDVQEAGGAQLSAATWYHIAVIRGWGGAANGWAITKNGTAIATLTDADSVPDLASVLYIGTGHHSGSGVQYINGWIDEFRVSKGVARWTANFTPPTGAYSRAGKNQCGILI